MQRESFEQRATRTPLRQVPPEWREQILQTAREPATEFSGVSPRRNSWLAVILWPSPKAWAALAAMWIGLAVFHASTAQSDGTLKKTETRRSPEIQQAWIEQNRLAAQLMGQPLSRSRASRISPQSQRELPVPRFKEC